MELRTIRYFVAVADEGSVTAAARAIHISQPSLSRQLRQLEKELGLELFTRQDGRLTLTPGGRQFLPVARDLVTRAEATKAAAASIRSGSMRTLTVAAPDVSLNDVIAPFFATFTAEDPMPLVTPLNPRDEYSALERGADLTVGTLPPPQRFASRTIARFPVYAYVRADHPLAGRGSVSLPELFGHHLLVLTPDFHTRRALDAAVEAHELPYHSITEFVSSRVAQSVAAAGRGVAVVSDDPRFGLIGLPISTPSGPISIRLFAAWQPHHHAEEQLRGLVDRLVGFVAERYLHLPQPAR